MKNKSLIVLLSLFVIFFFLVSYNRFFVYNTKREDVNKNTPNDAGYYIVNSIENEYNFDAIKDQETYKENIIKEAVLNIEYQLIREQIIYNSNIFIDKDRKLYVNIDKKPYKLSDEKFTTLYLDYQYNSIVCVYAITNNNDLYKILINGEKKENVLIYKINLKYKVTNFTDLNIPNEDGITHTLILLATDGNMYDNLIGTRYIPTKMCFDSTYYIYEDNSISNEFRQSFGKYKIQYLLMLDPEEKNIFYGNPSSIIITDNNNIIYMSGNSSILYESKSVIENIKYEIINKESKEIKLEINMNDKEKIDIKGYYSDYYNFNNYLKK